MIADIKAFAPKTVDPADIADVNKLHGFFRNAKGEVVGQKLDFIGETLMENYRNYVKAGRVDNFPQRRYLTPTEYTALQKEGKTQSENGTAYDRCRQPADLLPDFMHNVPP